MANVSHAVVTAAFEKRYDYQSARNVLRAAMSRGGLTEKEAYGPDDCKKIVAGLQAMGERGIDALITALTGGAPAAAPAGDGAKAAEKPAPKEEKKAEAPKEEKKADAPKEEKKEGAKDEAKADAKGEEKKEKKEEKKADAPKEEKKAEEKK